MLARPWFRLAGSGILILAVLLLFPRQRVLAALRNLDPWIVIAALPAYIGIHVAAGWRWHLLLQRAGAGLPAARSLECYFAGLFGTLFLPSAAGGDAIAMTLAMRGAKSRAGVIAGTVVNRALDTLTLGMLVAATFALVPGRHPGERLVLVAWVGAAVVALTIAAAAMAIRARWRPRIAKRLLARHGHALMPLRRPSLIALPLVLSIGTQLALAMLSYRIGLACGVAVGPGVWIFVWTVAKLTALLPVTIAGIGAREFVLASLLAPAGVPAAISVAAALAWDVVIIAGCLTSGAIWKLVRRLAPPQSPMPKPTES